jgi:hypothetical protein
VTDNERRVIIAALLELRAALRHAAQELEELLQSLMPPAPGGDEHDKRET